MNGGRQLPPRVAFHKRLYVWSVIFEPLLFFVLFEESVFGITGNLSRLLQLLTCVVLFGRFVFRLAGPDPTVPVPRLRRPLYRYYVALLCVAALAGIVGYFRGAYELPAAYGALVNRSTLSRVLNSAAVRPVFEYLAALYYFGYFVVLPRYLLTTPADISYALSRFKRMFVLSFIVGVIDVAFSASGKYLVPRHLSDWAWVDPGRFHGLAGEPRQAFVYLFLGLAMLHLLAISSGRRPHRGWIVATVVAAALTQSMTGVVAVALFIGLYGVYAVWGLSLKRTIQLAAGLVVVAAIAYGATVSTPRMMAYVESASDLWYILETKRQLPELMSKSNSDIYPMYDLTVKARAGDWVPVLIGSGFGSASAATNRYYREWSELNNPHSQLARSLYETGLVGTFLYVMTFVGPVTYATRRFPKRRQREFIMLTILLVSCSLADRSAAPFIYLGTFAAAFRTLRLADAYATRAPQRSAATAA